jgi:acetyl-CoA C-acetyltransferase
MAGLSDRPVYLVDGARTPFLKARGRPGPLLRVRPGRPGRHPTCSRKTTVRP